MNIANNNLKDSMQQFVIVLIFTIFGYNLSAQEKVITLHPVVGDSIDRVELKKYYLFTEFSEDSLDYITLIEDNYLLFACGYRNDVLVLKNQISEEKVLSQRENIQKLHKYLSKANVQDTVHLDLTNDSILLNNRVNFDFNTPDFQKSIKKENRRKFWKERRNESRKHQQKGIHLF